MVIPARPVNCNIGLASDNEICGIETGAYSQLAEIVESVEAGTVESSVYFVHFVEFLAFSWPWLEWFCCILLDNGFVGGRHPVLQVGDIIWVMEFTYFFWGGTATIEHPHVLGKLVIFYQTVCHSHSLGLHGMILTEHKVCNFFIVDIGHLMHIC